MKRQILISLILLSSVLIVNAQWNGTNPVWTNSNTGIGTTTPNARLDLGSGYGTSGAKLLMYNDDFSSELAGTKCGFYMDNFRSNNLNLVFPEATNNPGLFTITAKNTSGTALNPYFSVVGLTGYVGIGTINPSYKLSVDGIIGPGANIRNDGGYGGIDFSDNGIGYPYSAKIFTFRSPTEYYGFTNDYGTGSYGQLSILSSNNIAFFLTGNRTALMYMSSAGNLGIGTTSPQYKLDVIGTIRAREIKVDLNGADFVFEKDYKLMPLSELEKFVREQKHLPEVASAKEMEKNGTDLGDLNSKFLQKMEEMTLYIIDQNKAIEELKQVVKLQSEKIEKLETASK